MAVAAMEPTAERAVFALGNLEADEEKTLWENGETEFGIWLNLACEVLFDWKNFNGKETKNKIVKSFHWIDRLSYFVVVELQD